MKTPYSIFIKGIDEKEILEKNFEKVFVQRLDDFIEKHLIS